MRVNGVSRDPEAPKAILVHFDRVPTDDEMRLLHEQVRHGDFSEREENLAMMVGRLSEQVSRVSPVRAKALQLLATYGYEFKPNCR